MHFQLAARADLAGSFSDDCYADAGHWANNADEAASTEKRLSPPNRYGSRRSNLFPPSGPCTVLCASLTCFPGVGVFWGCCGEQKAKVQWRRNPEVRC